MNACVRSNHESTRVTFDMFATYLRRAFKCSNHPSVSFGIYYTYKIGIKFNVYDDLDIGLDLALIIIHKYSQ